jgi:hypothetical protein
VKWTGHIHRDHHKSWISPNITRLPRLLFASDVASGDVYIFELPQMLLEGTITGFIYPQGECSDKHGNVYVADTNAGNVYEYSRDLHLRNTYPVSYGPPEGCAVNPTNGNLAVTTYPTDTGATGAVLIYSSTSSSPTVLTNPEQFYYEFAGYDPSGNLWTDGFDAAYSTTVVSSCGASSCSTVNLSGGTIGFPGAIEYDTVSKNWVIFDQYCDETEGSCSYPVSATGALGTQTVYLNHDGSNACDLVQGVIAAYGQKYVAGADYEYCGYDPSSVNRWAYPAGGMPTNHTDQVVSSPIGAAISTK